MVYLRFESHHLQDQSNSFGCETQKPQGVSVTIAVAKHSPEFNQKSLIHFNSESALFVPIKCEFEKQLCHLSLCFYRSMNQGIRCTDIKITKDSLGKEISGAYCWFKIKFTDAIKSL